MSVYNLLNNKITDSGSKFQM